MSSHLTQKTVNIDFHQKEFSPFSGSMGATAGFHHTSSAELSAAKPTKESNQISVWHGLLAMLLFLALFIVYVYRAIHTQEILLQAQDLKKEIKLEYLKNNSLKLDLSERLSLQNIERIAKEKYQLKTISGKDHEKIIYIQLGKGKSLPEQHQERKP